MIVVADTSPLTALLHLRQLPLLAQLYGTVYLPTAVAEELKTLPAFGYDVSFLNDRQNFVVRHVANEKLVKQLSEELDRGEAEAIASATELKADLLLIDERLGKAAAETANLRCKGVVSVLIEAEEKRPVSLVKPLPDDLVQNLSFRLSDKIYRLALQKAGEN